MYPTRVACRECAWETESIDRRATLHASVVHNTIMCPGHTAREVEVVHTGQHPDHWECTECKHIRSRRAVITTRALHTPEGASPYEYTKGMTKADALQFWVDAKALGMVGVGKSKRGARLFALPNYSIKL